jgi:hypothetical protein
MRDSRHEKKFVRISGVTQHEIISDTIMGVSYSQSRLLHQGELGLYCADLIARFHDFWSNPKNRNGKFTSVYHPSQYDVPIVQFVGHVDALCQKIPNQFDGYRVLALRQGEFSELCDAKGLHTFSVQEEMMFDRHFGIARSSLGTIVSPLYGRGLTGIQLQAQKLADFWRTHHGTDISQFPVLSYRRNEITQDELTVACEHSHRVASVPLPTRFC